MSPHREAYLRQRATEYRREYERACPRILCPFCGNRRVMKARNGVVGCGPCVWGRPL